MEHDAVPNIPDEPCDFLSLRSSTGLRFVAEGPPGLGKIYHFFLLQHIVLVANFPLLVNLILKMLMFIAVLRFFRRQSLYMLVYPYKEASRVCTKVVRETGALRRRFIFCIP